MTDETAKLAAYVADLSYDAIPRDVLERAKHLTLDFLGSAVRARRRPAEAEPVRQWPWASPRGYWLKRFAWNYRAVGLISPGKDRVIHCI